MRGFTPEELKIYEEFMSMTQEELLEGMSQFLNKKYDKVCSTKDYVYAVGEIPICLVAHLDTVFPRPSTEVFYDRAKGVITGYMAGGADDRAGVFAIVQILRTTKLRPHIIFTTDEEKGCVGARVLSKLPCPFPDLRYIIQLDRRGANDCVFYDCYVPEFIKYVESFGFVEAYGSFSDISELCPAWHICGVNLSVGYQNEHTYSEILQVPHLLNTIHKVKRMLTEAEIPYFKYKSLTHDAIWNMGIGLPQTGDDEAYVYCCNCHQMFSEFEVFPVKGLDDRTHFYCPDCIPGKVEWCIYCGEAFEIDPTNPDERYCRDCRKVRAKFLND